MNKATRNALFGFVAGAAAGTLTGLLVAPEKGSKTRKKITKKIKQTSQEVADVIGEKVDEMKDKVNEVVDEMRSKADQAEEEIKGRVNAKAKAAKEATSN